MNQKTKPKIAVVGAGAIGSKKKRGRIFILDT